MFPRHVITGGPCPCCGQPAGNMCCCASNDPVYNDMGLKADYDHLRRVVEQLKADDKCNRKRLELWPEMLVTLELVSHHIDDSELHRTARHVLTKAKELE